MRRSARPRRGFTLVELLMAIIIAGVVFALLTLTGLRQQRLLVDLLDDAALAGQVREASSLLPIQLRGLGAAAGDVREASDTALEIDATIASGVVCDTASGSLVLAAATAGADTYTSYATSIQAGDVAWLYTPGDVAGAWMRHSVTSVSSAPAGRCNPRGPTLALDVAARVRTTIALDSTIGVLTIGHPLRVTRRTRVSLYRSADGSWNLGARDWNPAAQRFNSIQPVAGPFLSADASGLAFTYLDSARVAMPTPVVDSRAVAAIAFTLRGQTRMAVRALGSASRSGSRLDSARAIVLLRNRR